MTTATALLKAPRFGIWDFKAHLSERIKSKKPMVLVSHGEPTKVVLDYDELIEMLELIDELQDKELLSLIEQGRASMKNDHSGVDAEKSLAKLRKSIKKT